MSVAQAREILIDDARRRRDDVTVRRLLSQRDLCQKHEKEGATDVARLLQKRTLEQRAANMAQRQQAKEDEKRARLDEALAAQRKAEATSFIHYGLFCFSLSWLTDPTAISQFIPSATVKQAKL